MIETAGRGPVKGQRELHDVVAVEIRERDPDQRQAPMLDRRHGFGEQGAGRIQNRRRRGRRAHHRVRARGAREVVEAHADHNGAAGATGRAETACDAIHEPGQVGVDRVE